MYQIKTYNKIAKEGLDLFGETAFCVGEEQQDPDAVLVRSKDLHGMEINPSLKCVARAGAGVNNIPVQACSDNGVVVFNTPGANANAVKELTLCAILAASRNLFEAVDHVRTLKGSGDKVEELVEAGKSAFMGCEVLGKTLGVIGLGAIGVMVANCAIGLGMEVLGYDPYISVDSAWGLSSCVHKAESLEEVYRKSDFITLHIPLMEKTRDMVGDQAFHVMRRGAMLLNFSRGGLVCKESLREALVEKRITRYITDFPDDELLSMENVTCIPHLGASTRESETNCALMAVRQVKDYLENGNITNSVNFPGCRMDRSSKVRIAVAHRNIPNMLGQISGAVARKNINILNMVNRGKGDHAYTLMDVDEVPGQEITGDISCIEGILAARMIVD